ncbi:dTDP-4-dehydrorhamnose reductase [Beutenbergia cavernae DSM 12333]|uniref:dTDP-4-dehydrorhamnose reductase n=1 Tax=Beutenbergia cavernae (strain ATCC BAA-8 / DSM 12333 / CCUG 43141 / JCM 11478 / NBRC 16432 / NCIMB 13614 / HKI 0122) TaxID=471853 RepID=C5C165_BEUC1|nr:dTDP-4-dehydrorhamnose reductase [Beutenbergia cavernae]ACQ79469.1 dTDP-4-dehydrorhamnose reductase [Beutenbergia cavernae DSM 12333]
MRILVTGAGGMLAHDVVARLDAEHEVLPRARRDLDVTDADAVRRAVAPGTDAVINCAAWTAVDDAESHEGAAFDLNALAPAHLAQACTAVGARLVQVSTDYVFDGAAALPYGEDAPLRPVSAYGRTKAAGEWAVRAAGADHLVVRTAWLYGAHGACFPRTMARLAAERERIDVVDDQLGQPTWTADVADVVARLLERGAPGGTYHATASGEVSWYGFTREIVASLGRDPAMVRPTTSAAFSRPAPRPAYSVLGHEALVRAGLAPIGDWRERWREAAPAVLGGPA